MFIYLQATNVKVENSVQAMCQVGMNVWMIVKPGYLVSINFATLETIHQTEIAEIKNEEIVTMVTIDKQLFVIVCKSGLLITVTSRLKLIRKRRSSGLLSLISAKSEKENIKFTVLNTVSLQLNAVEVFKPENDDQVELWCGCENGIIEIFILCDEACKLQLRTILHTHNNSTDIPQNASIIQLKSSIDAHTMYALHSCGSVISCWSVCEQPILNTVIKLTQLSSPGRVIYIAK